MFKRLFWLTVGTALGFWGSLRLQRQMRERLQRYAPDRIAEQASASARALAGDFKAAAHEGATAMREREESLRAQFRPPAR